MSGYDVYNWLILYYYYINKGILCPISKGVHRVTEEIRDSLDGQV
jgi:hypothetical protein